MNNDGSLMLTTSIDQLIHGLLILMADDDNDDEDDDDNDDG